MGQSSSVRSARDEAREDYKTQDYLSQFAGHSPGVGKTQLQLNLEARRNDGDAVDLEPSGSCGWLPCVNQDYELVSATTNRPFKTDLISLADVDGDGLKCGELCRAICMTATAGGESLEHNQNQDVVILEGPGSVNVYNNRGDGEVLPILPPAELVVPPQFSSVEYDWVAPSITQSAPSPEEQVRLQSCMKPFLQAMLAGVVLQLRLDKEEVEGTPDGDGKNIEALAALNPDMSLLLISVGGLERSVPVRSIRWVRPPETGNGGITASWFLPSDRDKMVVFRLAGGRFVRFRFDRRDQAAFFGTCMRLMVKAARIATPADQTSFDAV